MLQSQLGTRFPLRATSTSLSWPSQAECVLLWGSRVPCTVKLLALVLDHLTEAVLSSSSSVDLWGIAVAFVGLYRLGSCVVLQVVCCAQ